MSLDQAFLDKEGYRYQIKIFKDVRTIEEIGMMTTHLIKKTPEIHIRNDTEIFTQNIKDSTHIKVSSKDFLPITTESQIQTPAGNITIYGEYRKGKVEIKATFPDDTKTLKIELPDRFYDNASALYLMRLFAFGSLNHHRFNIVNINVGQRLMVELELGDDENGIDCALGTFDCRVVRMKLCDYSQVPAQKFFYDKKEPHYMIKNVAGPQVIELKEILN
jgi:hypothetical protein